MTARIDDRFEHVENMAPRPVTGTDAVALVDETTGDVVATLPPMAVVELWPGFNKVVIPEGTADRMGVKAGMCMQFACAEDGSMALVLDPKDGGNRLLERVDVRNGYLYFYDEARVLQATAEYLQWGRAMRKYAISLIPEDAGNDALAYRLLDEVEVVA